MSMDLRYEKTEDLLKSAFIDFLSKKSLDNIFVSEICKEANCNRKTFYLHYKDKYDLFENYENEIFNGVSQKIEDFSFDSTDKENIEKFVLSQLDYIENHKKEILLFEKNDRYFWEKLSNKCKEKAFKVSKMEITDKEYICSEYSSVALLGLYRLYIKNYDKIEKVKFLKYVTEFSYTCEKLLLSED